MHNHYTVDALHTHALITLAHPCKHEINVEIALYWHYVYAMYHFW